MEIPVTTTTASSSSLGDQTVSDSPNSLTTQPSEMLTQIADFLPLTEQLRLRGQVGNHRLLNFITEFLSEKRKLMLKINYLPYETIYGSMTKFLNDGLLEQIGVCRAAVRRIVKQQSQPPDLSSNPNLIKSKQNTQPLSSSSVFKAFPLWEVVDDCFLSRMAMEMKKKKKDEEIMYKYITPDKAEKAFQKAHGYIPSVVAAFRRSVGFQPRLLHFLTSFEVVSISNDTESLEIAAAALASFLHSTHKPSDDEVENENEEEETDQQSSHIQLDSFAFYALSFGSNQFPISNILARLYKILSLTEMPPAPSVDNFTSTCTVTSSTPKTFYTTQPNSSLESLKSLTLVSTRANFDIFSFGRIVEECESDWRSDPIYSDPLSLPIFPAVEELVLGGIHDEDVAFLFGSLSPVFPALQRLVLVLKSKETGSVKPVIATLRCISAQCRQHLTALSVYSFGGLLALHRRESELEAKEAAKKVKKNEDQEEEEDKPEVVSFVLDELLAYVREHFPKVAAAALLNETLARAAQNWASAGVAAKQFAHAAQDFYHLLQATVLPLKVLDNQTPQRAQELAQVFLTLAAVFEKKTPEAVEGVQDWESHLLLQAAATAAKPNGTK
ncbi:hypothetical protein TYRP_023155 [Tyrophagus putrescentiae]|nr:hypothetical protein TYRP_023155 [Tyrophagus putrescentiae]